MPSATTYTPMLYPLLTPSYVLAFQFSSWYSKFAPNTIKSTIIRPLSEEFVEYLSGDDGVVVPEGADDVPAESTLSDNDEEDADEDDDDEEPRKRFAFPEFDERIREAVRRYGAVFPKLNFSSPKDASWVLPMSSPLKCTCPADVYILLKSSDFVSGDVDRTLLFEGCEEAPEEDYQLEMILRKWYPFETSREVRCFVRNGMLIAISQRDNNHYDFWNEADTQKKVLETVQEFWREHIQNQWDTSQDYTFDLLLTRSLTSAHIVDFNPYAPRTDPLLFTYEELLEIFSSAPSPAMPPTLRVVDSRTHPAATRNSPANQHNMIPREALELSEGRTVEEFRTAVEEEIGKAIGEGEER